MSGNHSVFRIEDMCRHRDVPPGMIRIGDAPPRAFDPRGEEIRLTANAIVNGDVPKNVKIWMCGCDLFVSGSVRFDQVIL